MRASLPVPRQVEEYSQVQKPEEMRVIYRNRGESYQARFFGLVSSVYHWRPGRYKRTICTRCGIPITQGTSAYCSRCFYSVQLSLEHTIRESQEVADCLQSKLLLMSPEKARMVRLLRKKERRITELEQVIRDLS